MSSWPVFTPNGTVGSTITRAPRSHAMSRRLGCDVVALDDVGAVRQMVVVRLGRTPRQDRDIVLRGSRQRASSSRRVRMGEGACAEDIASRHSGGTASLSSVPARRSCGDGPAYETRTAPRWAPFSFTDCSLLIAHR